MKPRKFFKITEINLMRQLAEQGKSQTYVAKLLGRESSIISRAAKRYNIEFVYVAPSGRPKVDPVERRRKRAEACKNWRRRRGIGPRPPGLVKRFDDPR